MGGWGRVEIGVEGRTRRRGTRRGQRRGGARRLWDPPSARLFKPSKRGLPPAKGEKRKQAPVVQRSSEQSSLWGEN